LLGNADPVKTIVINLERSHKRRELMQRNLDHLHVDFEFFRGIDAWQGEHLSLSRHDERASIIDHRKPLTIGEVGCFASHYLLWQRCAMAREPFVILEDDVMISEEFPRVLSAARELIGRLRLIRLGIVWDKNQHWRIGHSHGFEVCQYPTRGIAGTQGYVVSPEGASNLVAHAAVWSLPVDHYMSSDERHGVHSFGIHPLPVTHADQEAYPTVVGTDRHWARMKLQVMEFLAGRAARKLNAGANPVD